MKSFILSLALLIAGYTSSFADNYFQDTLWMKKTDQADGFYMLKFSKNDSIIAAFGYEKTIFYEAKTGNEIARIDGNGFGRFINNDNQFIRVATGNSGIEILDTKTWQRVGIIENEGLSVGSFDLTSDEKYLVAVIKNGIRKWDLATRQIIKTKTFGLEPKTLKDFSVSQLSISFDNSNVMYSVNKGYVDTFPPFKYNYVNYMEIADFNSLDSINIFSNSTDYCISKNNKFIALRNFDVQIYDFASKQLLHKLPINGLNVTGLEFSSDEKYLVTSVQYPPVSLSILNLETFKEVYNFKDGGYSNFNISHNQKTLISSIGNYLIEYPFKTDNTNVPQPKTTPTLYPNPTNGLVNINLQSPILGTANIQITNVSGNILMNIPNIIPQNNIVSLNISQLPMGTYFLNLSANNFHQTYKLIKE